jgi:hypothetical protein
MFFLAQVDLLRPHISKLVCSKDILICGQHQQVPFMWASLCFWLGCNLIDNILKILKLDMSIGCKPKSLHDLPVACEYVIGKVLKLGAKSHMT